jgi:hypothetical protein
MVCRSGFNLWLLDGAGELMNRVTEREREFLTSTGLAARGTHIPQRSISRWANDGLIEAEKTAGGQWRVKVREIIAPNGEKSYRLVQKK